MRSVLGPQDLQDALVDGALRDDVLDVISTDAELGKTVGSDAEEKKNTYMALLGLEGCNAEIEALTASAVSVLKEHFPKTEFLAGLAETLAKRNH